MNQPGFPSQSSPESGLRGEGEPAPCEIWSEVPTSRVVSGHSKELCFPCLSPYRWLGVRDTGKAMGDQEGVREERRLGTKAKKVVWTRVQGTSKQLRTMKVLDQGNQDHRCGSCLQPGEHDFQGEVSKSGRWRMRGTKTSARKPVGKHFGAHLSSDAKDSRATPRKTPSLAYRHLIGRVCGRPCLCLPERGLRSRQYSFPGHAY